MDWKKIALGLTVHQSTRINCPGCGGKNSASITNMGNRYTMHCFKCKEVESMTPPPMTPQERLALRKAAEAFEASEPKIPEDFTTDIPSSGIVWLSKGGLHIDDIKRLGFGWSPKHRRVILPCWEPDGTLVCVQARNTGDSAGPKYISQVTGGPRPVFRSDQCRLRHSGGEDSSPLRQGAGGTLVLTEDILSAARVGKVNLAWSLLGTNLMDAVIHRIARHQFDEVVVWMDDDEAGHNARRKMLRQLGAVGIEARAVVSDRDPKNHTNTEIMELLK